MSFVDALFEIKRSRRTLMKRSLVENPPSGLFETTAVGHPFLTTSSYLPSPWSTKSAYCLMRGWAKGPLERSQSQ